MELLEISPVETKFKENYRIKICVNFICNNTLIKTYKDNITDNYLLFKINIILHLLQLFNINDIPYAYFQKSNYSDYYSILFHLNLNLDEKINSFFKEILKDENLRVLAYLHNSKNPIYITKEMRLPYRHYHFIWYCSIDSFIQINPETSEQTHNIVEEFLIKDRNINLYCLGGEMGIYGKKFRDDYKEIKCLTNSSPIYHDYCYNQNDNNCLLVDYNNLQLSTIINTTNNILIVNISRNGLKDLAKQICLLNFKQIIYIGCCKEAIIKDMNILKEKYKVNRMRKLNQFPQTKEFLYIIELVSFLLTMANINYG